MKVVKRINNNAVMCTDSKGRSVVAFGKGIAFAIDKETGDLPLAAIERTFYNVDEHYLALLEELSPRVLAVSAEIIQAADLELPYELSHNAVLALADHITFALQRAKRGITVQMPLAYDVAQMYPIEYKVGVFALRRIFDGLNVELAESEGVGIAMCLLNARLAPENEAETDAEARDDTTSDITGVLLVAALLLMIMAVQFGVLIAGGLMACCTLGYCGSTAHANFARRFARTPYLARAAALSYGLGVLVQVLNHMVMPAGIPQQFVLVACAVVQVALLHDARRAKLRGESEPGLESDIAELSVDASEFGAKWQNDSESTAAFRCAVVRLTIATACLTGVFAALNAGLTTSHAAGAIDLGDWPRLLMGVSALVAGALFDLRGRSYMNIVMTCAAMLSTLSFFVLITDGNGGNTLTSTIIFYLGSGFFVVFFTTKFAVISVYAHWSYLWPCMGRVINNVCAMFVTAPAVAIVSSQNVLLAVGAGLVLFVGIAISLLGQFGHRTDDIAALNELAFAADDLDDGSVSTQSEPAPAEASELTLDERLDAFAAAFELTQRERDILEALVTSNESVQDIAATLFLSRSTFYRHIASINKKTGAASRVALINFFWSWSPKD